ncbi:putative 2-oxoglutarate-dependent dioxygenase AOP1 [Cucumis melo var. makuwa]|nr:putative 2-oxoglutarate-dependent dioxygenase AOP1 [Cucumis melo var. makuwa]
MATNMSDELPVVKFCSENLKSGTKEWVFTMKKVREALEDYGCFVALYDSVSAEVSSNMFDSLKELFDDVPLERKLQNVSEKPYHGYFGQNPLMPIHESMGIEHPILPTNINSFTNLMWPSRGNDSFRESVTTYAKLVSELDERVKRMVFESYGVGNALKSHMESTKYLMRMIKYRVPKEKEMNLGAFPHTDKSFLTILHQNEVNGLQIKTRDNKWIQYHPFSSSSTSSFIVMAGDAFFAWSNGRIYSPPHRVIMSGNRERYSVGLFSFNNGIVQIPEELVDDKHPQLFNPFDHQDFLRFYSTERGQNSPCAIKAYCGVGNSLIDMDTRSPLLLH